MLAGAEAVRGYYISTRVVEISGRLQVYGMLSGCRELLEPSSRFSSTRLASLAATAPLCPKLPSMVAAALAQGGDKLAP